jgi:hypothetical protein
MMHKANGAQPERRSRRSGVMPATALLLALGQSATAADLLVVDSTAPGFSQGDVTPTGDPIDIPRDSALTLLAPSGGLLRIEGPWQGQIDAPEAADPGLIQRLVALFQTPSRRVEFGATRSVARCLTVDLDRDRDLCVSGAPSCVVFRSEARIAEPVVLGGPSGSTVQLRGGIGADMWRWPSDFISEGGTYLLKIGSAMARPLDVHLAPDLPSRAHEIAWMSEQGCTGQAQAALEGLADQTY